MKPRGIENIWLIGDNFTQSSVQQYYMQQPESDFYSRTHFEVSCFYADRFSFQINILYRLRSALVSAVNSSKGYLPRLIVFIIEEDMIKFIKKGDFSSSRQIERIFSYLMNEARKIIMTFKDLLPQKSKRFDWPHMLWIQPVKHTNFDRWDNNLRDKIISSLQTTVSLHSNTSSLELKQIWDEDNNSLYLKDRQRFTASGYADYWKAVNKSVKFCIKQVLNKQDKITKTNYQGNTGKVCDDQARSWKNERFQNKRNSGSSDQRDSFFRDNSYDRFHWHKDSSTKRYRHGEKRYSRLPSPPPSRR